MRNPQTAAFDWALVSPPDPNNGFIVDLGQARPVTTVKTYTTKAGGTAYRRCSMP